MRLALPLLDRAGETLAAARLSGAIDALAPAPRPGQVPDRPVTARRPSRCRRSVETEGNIDVSRTWTNTEAFDHFGTRLTNARWSWSGIAPDGSVVALVLWQDAVTVAVPGVRARGPRAFAGAAGRLGPFG